MSGIRSFLFLQGPYGPFFYQLGKALEQRGCRVRKVITGGGDWIFWPSVRNVSLWRGHVYEWPLWISRCMEENRTTDIVLMGDWRPLHREAVLLAQQRGIRIWVYEEGYLRPRFVTLEEGGVNGTSPLPKTAAGIQQKAQHYTNALPYPLSTAGNPMPNRVRQIMTYFAGLLLCWPLFPRYKTHRPDSAIRELTGIIPRYFMRHRRRRDSLKVLRTFLHQHVPFYFMPLQLDSDSQIRRHSPFTGVLESMAQVITSFAKYAPKDSYLLIKNHPFDNGLINYRRYMRSLGRATGCASRLRFIEAGVLKEGDKLPSVRQLARDNGINPNTVARAYSQLEDNGIVVNVPKKGVYVASVDTKSTRHKEVVTVITALKENGVTKEEIMEVTEMVFREV